MDPVTIRKLKQDFPGGTADRNVSANIGIRVRSLVWEDPIC